MSVELVNGHVLIPHAHNWRQNITWSRKLQTARLQGITGREQRTSLRARPLQTLTLLATVMDANEQARLEDSVRAARKSGQAAVPYWGRGQVLSGAASGTSVPLAATPWVPAAGDYVFFGTTTAREVRLVSSYAAGTITLSSPLTGTYAAGEMVWPVLFGRITTDNETLITSQRGDLGITFAEVGSTDLAGLGGASGASALTPATYRGLPVFPFAPNWAQEPARQFQFDLNVAEYGFGPERHDPTQAHVVHGFEFSIELTTDQDIANYDAFTVAGPRDPFWLASPIEAVQVSAGVSTTQFDIADQNLTESLADHPAQHLVFSKAGVADQRAKIIAVADQGGGIERVTLDTALATAVDETWTAARLHLVRLAEDKESATFEAEGWQRRSVRVIELPNEYDMGLVGKVVAHWRMEEASGSRVDSIGALGTSVIGTVSRVTGKIGYALGTTGGSVNVQAVLPTTIGDTQFGFFGWVKFNVLASGAGVLSDWVGSDLSWVVATDGTKLYFKISVNGTTTAATVTSALTLTTGVVYFFVVWHDSVANEIVISVNNETPARTAHSGGMNTSEIINFAVGDGLFFPYLNGALDCIGYFKGGVPTLADIAYLYNFGDGRNDPFTFPEAVAASTTRWLYHFTLQSPAPVHWYAIGGERAYTAHGHTWTPLPVAHGALKRSIKADPDKVSLTSFDVAGNPLSLWRPYPPSAKTLIEIFEDIDGAATLVFTGRIINVEFTGRAISAGASAWLAELDRKILGPLLQPRCNNFLFDANCQVPRGDFDVPSTVVSVTDNVVQVNVGAFTTGNPEYFAGGEFRHGDGTAYEVRTILKASLVGGAVWNVTLNLPIVYAAASDTCTLWPGCDGRKATCEADYDNVENFFGFPFIPTTNPAFHTVTPKQVGGKK